jgi:hypothetical protein
MVRLKKVASGSEGLVLRQDTEDLTRKFSRRFWRKRVVIKADPRIQGKSFLEFF